MSQDRKQVIVDLTIAAPIETVWSPKIGLVHGPYTHWRTGDHRPAGMLVATGPDLPTGVQPDLDARDLAPTLLARLGVDTSGAEPVDGSPVGWLAGSAKIGA